MRQYCIPPFAIAATRALPRSWWLYQATSENGELLYVGVTRLPYKRLKDHQRYARWWPETASLALTDCGAEWWVLAVEAAIIEGHQPRFNRQGK